MNTAPEPKPVKKVISHKNLPLRAPIATLGLFYHLYDIQYVFPLWVDVVFYSALALWFLILLSEKSKEAAVDIFKE